MPQLDSHGILTSKTSISELKQKLDETRLDESSMEQLEVNCQAEKESRERIERENKVTISFFSFNMFRNCLK